MDLLRSISKPVFAALDRLVEAPRGPRILIYHQVAAGHDKQTDVTLDDFQWQIEWLSNNRTVVDLDSALSSWNSPDADRKVVLTFDDGYLDTYTNVFPMMRAHGFPFTVYVATSYVGDHHSSLKWDQLREMEESGLATIAAHTHSHADMRTLDHYAIVEEIERSNSLLEENLGIHPRHFAYPWGYWTREADAVIRMEYSTAVLGAPRLNTHLQRLDPYQLHRFPVQLSDGRRWFEARLEGGMLLEEELRRRIRGYRGP